MISDWQDRVLFIDGEAIVVDKPAGLAVHPGPKTRESLEDYLDLLRFGFKRLPMPVHRLDRDTSGCLLLARNPKAHKSFAGAFAEGRVQKLYLAAVERGFPHGGSGLIDLPLLKRSSREQGWRMVAAPEGRPARTRWKVIVPGPARALIAFVPETGRTHQVRAHAAYGLGAPIVGDPIYGRGGGPLLLHAALLGVPREDKPPVRARAELPAHFAEYRDLVRMTGDDDGGV